MSRPARPAERKLVPIERIAEELEPERRQGRRIVFTNGCYDLLHVGHLRLLEAAAREGDVLVVGLNGDASVTRLKGPGRPFVPFEERALLLAGLECVDWVVGFTEDTPAAAIETVLPDVLVKGGDWGLDRIVGREFVEGRGGRVLSLPLVPGRSTSALVERVREIGEKGSGDPP